MARKPVPDQFFGACPKTARAISRSLAPARLYGQQEVMRDRFDSAESVGLPIVFDAEDVRLRDLATEHPIVTWRTHGAAHRLDCDFVAGCDGFHGVSRSSMPPGLLKTFERVYPFGWLGALASMRSLTRSRYYIQCALDEPVAAWPDVRFWDELCLRLGAEVVSHVVRGPSFEKSIAPLRSFVSEPTRYGRLFLAGDAAHIVPPTGAKGLNLAVTDAMMLSEGLADYCATGSEAAPERYSERALARVWKAERFSWWFTTLTHRFPQMDAFDRRIQSAALAYMRASLRAQAAFAENYVGLPLE